MELVQAEEKPYMPCVNSVEARFYIGDLKPITKEVVEEQKEVVSSKQPNDEGIPSLWVVFITVEM